MNRPVLKHIYCPTGLVDSTCQSTFVVDFAHDYFKLNIDIPSGQGTNVSFFYSVGTSDSVHHNWVKTFSYYDTEMKFLLVQGHMMNISVPSKNLNSGPLLLPMMHLFLNSHHLIMAVITIFL